MPRVALTMEQRKDYKVLDFKSWVIKQMKLNGKRQSDVAKILGVSNGRVSQMLRFPKKGEKLKTDVFSYGQLLLLCEYFNADEEERRRLMTL